MDCDNTYPGPECQEFHPGDVLGVEVVEMLVQQGAERGGQLEGHTPLPPPPLQGPLISRPLLPPGPRTAWVGEGVLVHLQFAAAASSAAGLPF